MDVGDDFEAWELVIHFWNLVILIFFFQDVIVGFGADTFEDLPRVISWVACGSAVAAFCLLLVPETSQRELESLVESKPAAD